MAKYSCHPYQKLLVWHKIYYAIIHLKPEIIGGILTVYIVFLSAFLIYFELIGSMDIIKFVLLRLGNWHDGAIKKCYGKCGNLYV